MSAASFDGMSLIIKRSRDVLMFRSGVARTAASLNELVDQLQEKIRQLQSQLQAERQERAFAAREYENRISGLLHDLILAKYQIARAALHDAPSPSALVH